MQLSDGEKTHRWQRVESLLFILRLFGTPYDLSLQTVLQLIDIIFVLPSITPLERASIRLLSVYCRLLRDNYSVLERLLNYFFQKVEKPELQGDCVELFLSICKDCAPFIVRNAEFTSKEREKVISRTIASTVSKHSPADGSNGQMHSMTEFLSDH